jgi:hypothetical protein
MCMYLYVNIRSVVEKVESKQEIYFFKKTRDNFQAKAAATSY